MKYFTGITEIPNNAFNGCTSLWKVAWSENVKTIGNKAFYNNKGIANINFLAEVTTIGDEVFYGCSGVLSATIPDSVTKIGSSVFRGATALEKLYIGRNVETIACCFLTNCTNVEVFCLASTPPALGYHSTGGNGNSNYYSYFFSYTTEYVNGTSYIYLHEVTNSSTIRLNVREDCVDLYKSAVGWKMYSNMIYGYNFE